MNIRTLLLALAAALAIGFAACGDDDDKSSATATTAPTQTTQPSPTATPVPEAFFDCTATHASTPPDAAAFPVTITDTAGNTATLNTPPVKIASLDAAHTEILYAIGAGDQVAAVDNFSDCPTAASALTKIDSYTPSLEAVTALQPDLVVLFYDPGGDFVSGLRATGVDVLLLVTPPDVNGAYEDIELLGKATGHVEEADALVTSMADEVHAIEASVAGETAPSVFHELDNTYYTVGDGSFVDDLYTILGAKNIGHDTGSSSQLSSEAIITANPDVIVLADEEFGESPGTVAVRPGWANINAVKNHRVVGVDTNIVSRPGPRIVDALRALQAALYP